MISERDIVASPCVKICRLDKEKKYCTACMRTLEEIVRWPAAGREERKKILENIEKRKNSSEFLQGGA